MGRPKTQLRLDIEEFLSDTAEDRDDWFGIPIIDSHQLQIVRVLVYNMQNSGYPIAIAEFDKANSTYWISRKVDADASSKKM